MPTANSLQGGTQPAVGTAVFTSTGTTRESLRIDWVGHAAQASVSAGPRGHPGVIGTRLGARPASIPMTPGCPLGLAE